MSILFLLPLSYGNNCFSQGCTKYVAKDFTKGFPKLKYCLENLGWRESVKKDEWRVTVYNTYEDADASIEFNIIEAGTVARGLASYKIERDGGSQSVSFFFTSEPKFVWDKIELIDKEGNKKEPVEEPDNKSEQTGNSDYTGEYTKWEDETNKALSLIIGETEAAIFVKNVGGAAPIIYKAIIPSVYRYDLGQDFMMIKFEGKDRFSLWDNGKLQGYFIRPGSVKETATIIIKNGLWKNSYESSSYKANIKMINGGIQYHETRVLDQPPIIFIKKAGNEYASESNDYQVIVKDPTTISITFRGMKWNDFKFISETEEKLGISATTLMGKWECSINYIKTNNIIVVDENEFIWDWVVKILLTTNKGQMTFKRQSGNVFVADNTGNNSGNQGWCRYVIKIINDNKLGLEIYNCAGKLGKTGELIRLTD